MKKLTIFLLFLLVLPLAISVAPSTQVNVLTQEKGLTVVYPKCITFSSGNSKVMSFDILNSTNARLTNKTTTCDFFMIDSFGTGITNGSLNYSEDLNYWHFDLNTTHTANEGCFSYYVHCNMSGLEFGFISEKVTIRKGGEEEITTDTTAIMIAIILFGLLFIILGSVMLLRRER